MSLDMLQRLLPLLKDAHLCVAGLPFDGSAESLRVELGLAIVKVDRSIRKSLAADEEDPADSLAFSMALATVTAMDYGHTPFEQARYDKAKGYMVQSFQRALADPNRHRPKPKRRTLAQ